MKYGWLFVLIGILALSFISNFVLSKKTDLALLVQLQSFDKPQPIKQNNREALIAKIYSTYPFNSRNLLTVNAGAENGVAVGMPVTVEGNLLIGQIVEVLDKKSIVKTIFDKNFSLPVRLGEKGIDALLAGGQDPRLTMIEKSLEIKEGDLVYSAGRDFPYGMKIGTVGKISDILTQSFKVASLDLPYQFKDLGNVVILIK